MERLKAAARREAHKRRVEAAVRAYVAGASALDAGIAHRIDAATVLRHVRAAGHEVRSGHPLPVRHPANLARVKALLEDGADYHQISRMMRVAPGTARELIKMVHEQGCKQ